MRYDLVLSSEVLRTKEFESAPPVLSPNKGKWLERVETVTTGPPTPLQKIETVHTITATQSIHTQEIVDRFSDIPDGPTKAEQETEYQAQQLKAAQTKLKGDCETAIINHIQGKVDAYNAENDLMLRDIYSCAHYAQTGGYTHQAFCAAVWAWNVSVWEKARELLAQAKAGEITVSSPGEVIDLLPEFVFQAA